MINLPPYPKEEAVEWPGLTLEQMQMRRALLQARMEIQKFKLNAEVERYKQKAPFIGGNSSVISRIAGAFSWFEYAFFAIRLYRLAAPIFRRKK